MRGGPGGDFRHLVRSRSLVMVTLTTLGVREGERGNGDSDSDEKVEQKASPRASRLSRACERAGCNSVDPNPISGFRCIDGIT